MPISSVPLVVGPQAGTPAQFVGTFLLTAVFFSLTAHIAARYVLGDVPPVRALAVGIPLAVVVVALVRLPPLVIILLAFGVDLLAFHLVYRLAYRTATFVAVAHYTVTLLLGLVITYTLQILSTAPV